MPVPQKKKRWLQGRLLPQCPNAAEELAEAVSQSSGHSGAVEEAAERGLLMGAVPRGAARAVVPGSRRGLCVSQR